MCHINESEYFEKRHLFNKIFFFLKNIEKKKKTLTLLRSVQTTDVKNMIFFIKKDKSCICINVLPLNIPDSFHSRYE